ncbi:hypothetical protein BKA56DRAFT_620423 [Ilyonectria sp. MPI-CAGE-AT-0026]|nr:hypothetical protein BKA56DRAFT_620423 [Ilyonectria sp. MPI-CAGE-AT-0026]
MARQKRCQTLGAEAEFARKGDVRLPHPVAEAARRPRTLKPWTKPGEAENGELENREPEIGEQKTRFFGWSKVVTPNPDPTIQVQVIHTGNTFLSECSQELYTATIACMADSRVADPRYIGEVTPREASGQPRLENAKISSVATAFAESGLGSYSDALLCIIPAFRTHLSYAEGDVMIPLLAKAATEYRKHTSTLDTLDELQLRTPILPP